MTRAAVMDSAATAPALSYAVLDLLRAAMALINMDMAGRQGH